MSRISSRTVVGLTGTPGTGKKSIAPLLASLLGIPSVSIDEEARMTGALSEEGEDLLVDTERLSRVSVEETGRRLVFGHLLAEAVSRKALDAAIVLRCEPKTLKERLRRRGYPEPKVLENVEAELIGYLAAQARQRFGRSRVHEFDTTATTPRDAAKRIFHEVSSETTRKKTIDWTYDYDSAPRLRSLLER